MSATPSIPCECNGKVYDLDLWGYNLRELTDLENRTGDSWRRTALLMPLMYPEAVKAPFWLTDRRDDPDLKWSEYDGPPLAVIRQHLPALREVAQAVGKEFDESMAAHAKTGSDDSPSDADTPPTPTTG